MAKYKKREDGRYLANIQVGVDELTGKRIFKSIYARSQTDLDNKKSDIKDKLNKGIYADDKGITIEKWAKDWFEVDKGMCGIKTKEMYELMVYKYIIPTLGHIRLKDLKQSDLKRMINANATHRRTCEQLLMTTKQMLNSAIEDGLLYKNVALTIKLPPKAKTEKRPLTDLEKRAISKCDFTSKEKAFVYILLYCGLRRGEALGLSRTSINLRTNEISIRNVVTFDKGKAVLKDYPKTNAGIRTLPIPNALKEVLEPYLKELDGLYLFEMERKSGLMSKSSYDKFWGNIFTKINIAAGGTKDLNAITGLSAHIFRHNYATILYYAGVDIKDAQRLLGHSSIRITLEIYTHLDKSKSTAGEKLSALNAL